MCPIVCFIEYIQDVPEKGLHDQNTLGQHLRLFDLKMLFILKNYSVSQRALMCVMSINTYYIRN